MKNLNNLIFAKLHKYSGLTQETFGEQYCSMSKQYVSNIINCRRVLSEKRLQSIIDAMGLVVNIQIKTTGQKISVRIEISEK